MTSTFRVSALVTGSMARNANHILFISIMTKLKLLNVNYNKIVQFCIALSLTCPYFIILFLFKNKFIFINAFFAMRRTKTFRARITGSITLYTIERICIFINIITKLKKINFLKILITLKYHTILCSYHN